MLLLLQATVGVGTLRVRPQLHAGEIVTQGIVAHILRHLTKLQQVPTGTEEVRGENTEVKFFISILEHEMVLELNSFKHTSHHCIHTSSVFAAYCLSLKFGNLTAYQSANNLLIYFIWGLHLARHLLVGTGLACSDLLCYTKGFFKNTYDVRGANQHFGELKGYWYKY